MRDTIYILAPLCISYVTICTDSYLIKSVDRVCARKIEMNLASVFFHIGRYGATESPSRNFGREDSRRYSSLYYKTVALFRDDLREEGCPFAHRCPKWPISRSVCRVCIYVCVCALERACIYAR